MCHVSYMNESCHSHEWVTSHIWIVHGNCKSAEKCAVRAVPTCVRVCSSHVIHFLVWHNSFIDFRKPRQNWGLFSNDVCSWHESCHTYECVTSWVWISHVTYVCHGTHVNESYEWVTSHIWMSDITHMNGQVAIAKAHQYAQKIIGLFCKRAL